MLRDQAHGASSQNVGWIGGWLVALQVAISCGLLVSTLMMVESVGNLEASDFGEEPDKVWTAQLMLDTTVFPGWQDWLRFYEQFAARVREIPGVSAVSFASHLPAGRTRKVAVEIEGKSYESGAALRNARWSVVTPDYFNLLGRPVLEGRAFWSSDTVENRPVVVINRSFAKLHFETKSPLGQRVRLRDRRFSDIPYTIVGVVPDLYLSWDYFSDQVDLENPQGIYLPASQHPQPGMYVIIRSDIHAAGLMRQVRDRLTDFSPDMPLLQPETMAGRIDGVTARYRMVRSAFSVLGAAALLLAVTGLFGLVSFIAAQKKREIAIHMALGANPSSIVFLSTGKLGSRVAVGIIVGIGLGLFLSSLLRAFLYDVKSIDLFVLVTVVAALCLMVAAACFIPVRRSVLVDPASVLRGE